MSELTVVAMGGNSLIDPQLPPTVENQFVATARAMAPVADLLVRGDELVITHGNGPQVGFMQLRSEMSRGTLHEVPLDSLVADTQGAIGYMIQRSLREALLRRGHPGRVATVVTEVLVAPDDPAFLEPSKPIGLFYGAAEAEHLRREKGWQMVEDARRGYRRVVPSPLPRAIVQVGIIRQLLEAGTTVVACGGGGIPVIWEEPGRYRGLEAVIDKDRAAALLGLELGAHRLVITTAVDRIYRDFLSDHPTPIDHATAAELRELHRQGQFPAGSMGPKVEAAVQFLEGGGREVVISRPEALADALRGLTGTRIVKENP